MNPLRDPIWQSIGALIAIFAVAVSYWQIRRQQTRKRVAFGVTSTRRLLSSSDEITKRVTVSVDGRPTHDVHVVVLCLRNIGNTPITVSDFDQPFRILFKDAQVLSIDIPNQTPDNLDLRFDFNPDQVTVQPLLMNPLDQFTMQVLTAGAPSSIHPQARLVGVPQIEALIHASGGRFPYLFLAFVLLTTCGLATITGLSFSSLDLDHLTSKAGARVLAFGLLTILCGVLSIHLTSELLWHLRNHARYFSARSGTFG